MAGLFEGLFPWVGAFYLWDSFAYLRANERALTASWRRFRLRDAGIRLVGLSPVGEVLVTSAMPVLPTAAGVFVPKRQSRMLDGAAAWSELDFIAFDDLGTLEPDEHAVRIDDVAVIRTTSIAESRAVVALLDELRRLPEAARWERIELDIRARFDVDQVASIRAKQGGLGTALTVLSAILFAATFVLWPLSATSTTPLRVPWTIVLACVLALHLAIVGVGFALLRRLGTGTGEQLRLLGSMFVFPVESMHAATLLLRRVFARFDTIAVAAVVMDDDAFGTLARREDHRLVRRTAEAGHPDVARVWTLRSQALRAMLTTLGRDVFRAPARSDPAAVTYCPVCLSEYRASADTCADCQAALVTFESARS